MAGQRNRNHRSRALVKHVMAEHEHRASAGLLLSAAERCGLRVAAEGFADREYDSDGSLALRRTAGAVLHEPARAADRAAAMVRDGTIPTRDGCTLHLHVDTICVHGDTPGAADIAAAVRAALTQAGIVVTPLGSR